MYRKNLCIGQKVGTRTIIEELPTRKNGYIMYKVQCDCGDVVILNGSYLRTRNRPCKSCSAKKHTKKGKEHYAFKHGYASRRSGRDQVYSVWIAMRARCNDSNNDQYHDYGGRGIKICKEWEDFSTFLSDMGKREEGMQIERIDNNGNYCKENCRWANVKEQANNRRNTKFYIIDGKKIPRTQILSALGITKDQFRYRFNRIGIEKIIDDYKKKISLS